jgi:hypothetical protein
MNLSKFEVIGHNIETRAMFTSFGINLPETSALEVIYLGASFLAGLHLDSVLEGKRLDLRHISQRLESRTDAVPRLSLPIHNTTHDDTFSGLRLAPTAPSCRYMMSHLSRL